MGPLPKTKISKGRRDRRRAHDAIGTPKLVECPTCHEKKLPYRVCPYCGQYQGRQVVSIDEDIV